MIDVAVELFSEEIASKPYIPDRVCALELPLRGAHHKGHAETLHCSAAC